MKIKYACFKKEIFGSEIIVFGVSVRDKLIFAVDKKDSTFKKRTALTKIIGKPSYVWKFDSTINFRELIVKRKDQMAWLKEKELGFEFLWKKTLS